LEQALSLANLQELTVLGSNRGNALKDQTLIDRNLAWLDQADSAARSIMGYPIHDREAAHQSWTKQLNILTSIKESTEKLGLAASKTGSDLSQTLLDGIKKDPRKSLLLLVWNFFSNLAGAIGEQDVDAINRQIADRRPVSELIASKLKEFGFSDYEAYRGSQVVRWLLNRVPIIDEDTTSQKFLESLLADSIITDYLEINTYNGIRWFNKEKFIDLLWYQRTVRFIRLAAVNLESTEIFAAILLQERLFKELEKAVEDSGYQLDRLIESLA
jgi:hypothetical protein